MREQYLTPFNKFRYNVHFCLVLVEERFLHGAVVFFSNRRSRGGFRGLLTHIHSKPKLLSYVICFWLSRFCALSISDRSATNYLFFNYFVLPECPTLFVLVQPQRNAVNHFRYKTDGSQSAKHLSSDGIFQIHFFYCFPNS